MCKSITCTTKTLCQNFCLGHWVSTYLFSMSNPRVLQTKLGSSGTMIQMRSLESVNPWQSLDQKNKHCCYSRTHPLYLRNGALGIQLYVIERKSHGIFNDFVSPLDLSSEQFRRLAKQALPKTLPESCLRAHLSPFLSKVIWTIWGEIKEQHCVKLWKCDCRTTNAAQKRVNKALSESLKYYKVTFCCMHGGKKFKDREEAKWSSK